MKKKGFTIIELLAVIILISALFLIVVPIVFGIINETNRRSFEISCEEIYKSYERFKLSSYDEATIRSEIQKTKEMKTKDKGVKTKTQEDRIKDEKVKNYSLGMKQRLGIAMALMGKPSIIILDEPTNGLDPAGIQEIRELIKSLPQRFGTTVLISSHLLSEVEQMADYVGIIDNGILIYQGPLSELETENSSLEEVFLKLTGGEA